MIDIAAIITTRNRPTFLRRALYSVAQQRYQPAEVIVVDDASDYDVARLLRSSPISVRLIRLPEHRGASGTRNIGAAAARSSVLAFLDDDDEWLPDYLERVAHAFLHGRAEVSCCSFIAVSSSGEEYDEKAAPVRLIGRDFLVRNPGLRGSNLAVAAEVFTAVGGFDEALPSFNDIDIGIRLADANLRYVPISERLVRYHAHDGLRLSTPGTTLKKETCRLFLAKHGARMSLQDRHYFCHKARTMWKVSIESD